MQLLISALYSHGLRLSIACYLQSSICTSYRYVVEIIWKNSFGYENKWLRQYNGLGSRICYSYINLDIGVAGDNGCFAFLVCDWGQITQNLFLQIGSFCFLFKIKKKITAMLIVRIGSISFNPDNEFQECLWTSGAYILPW